jgi:hypothetical protein
MSYPAGVSQITFHYIGGSTESFDIYGEPEDSTPQGIQLEMRHLLNKDWWVLSLPEQTVMVNIDNVLKVEMKPTIEALHGEGVFANAERVTALSHR